MLTFALEKGPFQVPVDLRAASKVTDARRRKMAIASDRYRRRKREQKNSILEAQLRKVTEQKDHYQQQCRFLRGVVQQNGIMIPAATEDINDGLVFFGGGGGGGVGG